MVYYFAKWNLNLYNMAKLQSFNEHHLPYRFFSVELQPQRSVPGDLQTVTTRLDLLNNTGALFVYTFKSLLNSCDLTAFLNRVILIFGFNSVFSGNSKCHFEWPVCPSVCALWLPFILSVSCLINRQ